MDLFTKLEQYIDYNNSYSLKKALTTLNREFDLAISRNDSMQAKTVIDATKKLYDKLSRTYRESEDYSETMSYYQKLIAKQMRNFIAYMLQKLKIEFGVPDYEQEIEQTIGI